MEKSQLQEISSDLSYLVALNAETGIKLRNLVSQTGRFSSEQPIAWASVAKLVY